MAFNSSYLDDVNNNCSSSSNSKNKLRLQHGKCEIEKHVCVHRFVRRAHLQIDVITNLKSRIEEKRERERERRGRFITCIDTKLSEFKTGQKQNWKSEKEKNAPKMMRPLSDAMWCAKVKQLFICVLVMKSTTLSLSRCDNRYTWHIGSVLTLVFFPLLIGML